MKILHVIPPYYKDDEVLDSALSLIGRMLDSTEIHVAAFEEDMQKVATLPITCHTIHHRHPLTEWISVPSQYIKILYQVMPDVVHIHGSWNLFGANVEKWSRKRGFKVVLSPHDRLRKHVWNLGFFKTRLLPTVCYQRSMVRHSCALHAGNEQERDNLVALKWNRHITMVRHDQPHLMQAFYQRVIDRDIHRQMSVDERQSVCYLLHTALSGDLRQTDRLPTSVMERLSAEQWRRIFIYTQKEEVTDLLLKGIEIKQLQIPYRHPVSAPPTESSTHLNRENGIVGMLADVRKHVKKRTVTLRHLSDLYQTFIQLDCDEDELCRELKEKKMARFTARMEQVLSEIFFLTEGFMPVKQRNDNHTEKIRKSIILKP